MFISQKKQTIELKWNGILLNGMSINRARKFPSLRHRIFLIKLSENLIRLDAVEQKLDETRKKETALKVKEIKQQITEEEKIELEEVAALIHKLQEEIELLQVD
jgi:hypothetical protein